MEQLLELLKDGHARTLEMLAWELNTDKEDIMRMLEYLEMIGSVKRVSLSFCDKAKCSECGFHSRTDAEPCKGCLPDGGFKNMGEMWEVVR